ncbi:MAG: DUF2520 domain-containing protein [Eubacterium sp.]|jgi:predicted short-subunit dehydrogenase-like oxidoreductase (DUF2520 family)|nr:DUF2520 domain-containing protein [Eubacterium sp.]
MKFGFIGAGKVGFSLGKYLADNNQTVVGYYSEFEEDAEEAAEFTGSKNYSKIELLVKDSDVLFLTVTDGMIETVWNQIKDIDIREKIICHTSGALSSEVFSDISKHGSFGFSIHPLFAVSDKYQSYKELSGSYFTIEGSKEKIEDMKSLFENFGNTVCIISKEDKVKYHGAAAIASNLVVGLIGLSEQLLVECGFDKESAHNALSPIIKGNVSHIIDDGCEMALTGPVERNDIETVKKHLAVLEGNSHTVYRTVSREVLNIAKMKNKDRDYSKMEDILK